MNASSHFLSLVGFLLKVCLTLFAVLSSVGLLCFFRFFCASRSTQEAVIIKVRAMFKSILTTTRIPIEISTMGSPFLIGPPMPLRLYYTTIRQNCVKFPLVLIEIFHKGGFFFILCHALFPVYKVILYPKGIFISLQTIPPFLMLTTLSYPILQRKGGLHEYIGFSFDCRFIWCSLHCIIKWLDGGNDN